MILPALVSLYDRLVADPATEIASPGFAQKPVSFKVVLKRTGYSINDLREAGKRKGKVAPKDLLVPTFSGRRTSGVKPGFLCDKTSYLFGLDDSCGPDDAERIAIERESFRKRHEDARQQIKHPAFDAVCAFLNHLPSDIIQHPLWPQLSGTNGVFQIEGEQRFVHEVPEVAAYWATQFADANASKGMCLVTGGLDASIADVHPPIKGVADKPGAPSEKAIVNFNKPSFTSYGKDQSLNAPVSELAAFKYATALNWLLDGPRPQRLRLGDTTVVFWTEKPSTTESLLGFLLGGSAPDDPAAQDATLQQKLAVFLETLRQGGGRLTTLGDTEQTPFFILGLAPNAARVSVRFWHAGTLGELHRNLKRHADDLAVQREYENDSPFPPLWLLLKETARTSDDVAPLLGGALARAVITGSPYPAALVAAVIRRIRADTGHVPYLRAALLKAFLNRNCQSQLTMSLDTSNSDPAYRLGRLFAALEKTQRDALGDTNTTVRERFYAAASATPGAVFPRVLRTYTHHLAKLDGGLKVAREQLVQEILDPIANRLPSSLSLEEQGRFALGYYQQMRAFFTKRSAGETAA